MAKSVAADGRRRRERGSISVDEILNGAFDVAAQVSVDNLSMPALAQHLEVGVTSIYWYFRKKDDLLNAMADRALGECDFTTPSIDADNWCESLREHARTMRRTFLSSPITCDLILIRGAFGIGAARSAFKRTEQPVAALVHAGLSPDDAFRTYAAIAVHVRGAVVMERLHDKMTGVRQEGTSQDKVIDAERTPLISHVVRKGHRLGMADDINFEFILNSILEHAGALIDAAQRPSAEGDTAAASAP
jgi:AcrR family transcriptional regulator